MLAAEVEVARIDDAQILEDAERRAARADVDHCDGLTHATVGNLVTQQLTGILEREGFDVDDLRQQTRCRHRCLPLFDVVGSRGNEQDVHQLGVLLVGADDLVVEADLFHRERDVLVRLDLDLAFEISLGKTRGHLDDFRDGRIATDRDGNIRCLCASPFDGTPDRLTDGLGIDYRLFTDRARWCGLRCVGLNAIPLATLRKLNELDRGGRDIEAQQRLGFFTEEHVFFLLGR